MKNNPSHHPPTIAAIIPCYNVAGYVGACLASVLNQTTSFTQVIVVDDASTDNTPVVIDRIRQKFNFTLIRLKRNQGLGNARNAGATLADSEFITFIDSDDYISRTLVADFHKYFQKNTDIDLYCYSIRGFGDVSDEFAQRMSNHYRSNSTSLGRDALCNLLIKNNFHSSSCAFIFRKNLMQWPQLGFNNYAHEDEEFTPRLFLSAQKTHIEMSAYYHYRLLRTNSITTSRGVKKWCRSRIGYAAALVSWARHFKPNRHCAKETKAFRMRKGYLFYHCFAPLPLTVVHIAKRTWRRLLEWTTD